jgi:hypothetical protein
MYSFLRLARPSRDQKAYYHPQFLRGRPKLSCYISRTRTANNVRMAYDASTEPDFEKMTPVSWQSVLPSHVNSIGSGPLPYVNQATDLIAELTSLAHHRSPTSVLTPVSAFSGSFNGESNHMVPSLHSGEITELLSSRKTNANSSSHNLSVVSDIGASPPGGWRDMSRVVSRDLELTKSVPEAPVPNIVSWEGQSDHRVSTSNPVETSLLDPNLANDLIYIFSERRALLLGEETSVALAQPQSPRDCHVTLREPSTGATDVSLSTLSSDDWRDMDFGTCSECSGDSLDWLDTIELESLWDIDNLNV